MYHNQWGRLTVVAIAAIWLVSGVVLAQEKKVKLKDLPEAVRKTVEEQSRGAKIRGLSSEVSDGKTVYEAELLVNGLTKDMLIDASGAILEMEEQVLLASLPAAVQTTFKQQAGKGRIARVEAVTKSGALAFYEAHVRHGLRTTEVKVSPEGQVVK